MLSSMRLIGLRLLFTASHIQAVIAGCENPAQRSQHGQRIRNGNEAEGNLQHHDKPGRIIDWGYITIPDRDKRRHAEIQEGNELAQEILADILAFEGSASEKLIDRHIHHREKQNAHPRGHADPNQGCFHVNMLMNGVCNLVEYIKHIENNGA
jgi:hypothetical protein